MTVVVDGTARGRSGSGSGRGDRGAGRKRNRDATGPTGMRLSWLGGGGRTAWLHELEGCCCGSGAVSSGAWAGYPRGRVPPQGSRPGSGAWWILQADGMGETAAAKSGMHGVGVPLTAELPSALKRLWKAPNPEVILAERRGGGCVYRSGAVLPPDQEQAVPQVAVLPWCAGCALPIAREIRVEGGEWCSARTPHLPTVLSLLYIDRPSLPSVAHPEPGGGFGLTGFARGVVQTLRSAFMTPA